MSKRREPGEPGRYMPAMDLICGHDGGYTDQPVCGKPAVLHLFAGSPEGGPSDWTMLACDQHAEDAKGHAWDYHPIGAVCDVPDSVWQSAITQGDGFCYWSAAEEALAEAIQLPESVNA